MHQLTWQLLHPINTIIFDCDGTLSAIEGIDELAHNNGASKVVKELTEAAMSQLGMNLELYEKRLELVQPTELDVLDLGQVYFTHRVPDVEQVIAIFNHLKKNIYIVSAGLFPSVAIFAEKLQIPRDHIYAVNIEFDKHGNYCNFDRTSPLVTSNGKRIILSQLKAMHQEIVFIGDGMNDLVASDLATRFIGYGGIYYRGNIADKCQFYINTPSLASLLPLTITLAEYESLSSDQQKLYQKGVEAIENGGMVSSKLINHLNLGSNSASLNE